MNRVWRRRAALMAAATFAGLGANVKSRGQTAESPVREVVLFSSGVGYFQHEGKVTGDASAQLPFKTAQINDVLKSLVLQDLDGGQIGDVTYPSQDPLTKTLGSFEVDISDNPSLGRLLNGLRGANVTFTYAGANGAEQISATIVGVETRQAPGGKEGAPVDKEWLNVLNDRGLRSLELDKIGSIRFDDPGLQQEFNRALAAVASARDQDKKPVTLHFNGQGERRVRIGYVIETPVWKASYRLVFEDAKPSTMQGWAIVDNETENDWKDVRLSLVSGRPISFAENLYQPLYVQRQVVTPPQYAGLHSPVYEEGQQEAAAAPAPPVMAKAMERSRAMRPPAKPAPELADSATVPALDPVTSVSLTTETGAAGELFQYATPHVSLPRQSSAMIPILNDAFDAEKVSIFNKSTLDRRPLNGVRLKNPLKDGKHLLQGPVTVFDGGRYAGDAQMGDFGPGQTRLLSYGVDLQLLVQTSDGATAQSIQSGRIVKGALEVTRKTVFSKEYSAESRADHDKKLIIEHPMRSGAKLVNTPAPVETTEDTYRFEENVPAGKTVKLTVTEESINAQQISILPLHLDDVLTYSRTGEIAAPVRDALSKAASLKQAEEETARQIADREAQVKSIGDEQGRMRENLKTVDRSGAYAARLLKKLDDQETQLEKLRAEIDSLREKQATQRAALADYLNNLNIG